MVKIIVFVGQVNCFNMIIVWKFMLIICMLCFRFVLFVVSGQYFLEEEVKKYEDDLLVWMMLDSDGSDGEFDDCID